MALPQLQAQAMMAMFREKRRRSGGFFSSFFKTRPGSTGTTGDEVVWDIERFSDEIAGTIDPHTGSNLNKADVFSTKRITPPWYGEGVAVNAADLVNRLPGEDPFSASSRPHRQRLATKLVGGLIESSLKIDRGMELQAAQVLQTGEISVPGVQPFAADFFPKATHFPTAGIAWSNSATAVPVDDLESLCNVIQEDARVTCTRAIMGRTALAEFMNCDQIKERFDFLRADLVAIDPVMRDRGATLHGRITVGSYMLEIWSYNGLYEAIGGGAKTPFLDVDKVVLLPDDPTLTICSLVVPQILPPDPRLANLVSVPTTSELGWDLTPNAWTDDEGTTVFAGFKARAVMVPQGIDEYGCLTT